MAAGARRWARPEFAIGVRAAVADHLGRAPTRAELTAARRAAHSLAALSRARVLHVPGGDAGDNAGDRSYLVLAKPGVIVNGIRLSGLAVAGDDAAGRKAPTTMPRQFRTLDGPCAMLLLVPGWSRQRGWTANRLPMSPPLSKMPSKSYTGSSAASIDVSDVTVWAMRTKLGHARASAELSEESKRPNSTGCQIQDFRLRPPPSPTRQLAYRGNRHRRRNADRDQQVRQLAALVRSLSDRGQKIGVPVH
jgi:hypothetical protein